MARPGASEEVRLRKLRLALERAIARGLTSQTLTFKPMCELLQVTRPTLRDWLQEPEVEASGAFRAGAAGVEYEFNVMATLWVLIRSCERKRDERVIEHLRIREAIAGDKLDGAPAEMTVKDATDAYRLALQIITAEREAGRLVDVAEVETKFTEFVIALRDTLLSAPQRLDPTSEWTPEFREKFDNALADCMVHMRQAGQEALSPDHGTVPAGSDGKDNGAPQRAPVRRSRGAGAKRAGTVATA